MTVAPDHTQTHHTRTPLDEGMFRRFYYCLVTRDTHKTQTSMLPTGLEPAVSKSEGRQTHALDGVVTGFGGTRFRPINMTRPKVGTNIEIINKSYVSV